MISGCMTTTRTRIDKTKPGRVGVDVEVHEDGTLKLYGNPINRKTLVKRLINEESADKGRAIVLQAKGDVRRAQLEELRDFLVINRIPNVVIVTQLNAYSYEESDPYWQDNGTQQKPRSATGK
jgi:biopolymer transport protein ExbD